MTMKHALRQMLAVLVVVAGFGTAAEAQLKITVDNPNAEPLPIAITNPTSTSPEMAALGRNVAQVITGNLQRSGLFRPLDPSSFIEQISNGAAVPKFPSWRQVNAQALVTGTVADAGGGRITLSFRLWDVLGEQQIAGKEYTTTRTNWRRISHIMSDEIYKRLTGEEGYFDSRVVYVAESGPARKKMKRIAIMDQDGENHKFLTDGRNLVLTPRFSPNAQEIVYLSYAGGKPRVYLRDLQTGREEKLGDFPGMTFAPRFSPDGKRVVFSAAMDGNSDVYVMDLRTRKATRLTNDPAIDTSPNFSPDGRDIVFNSDRGGSQQLYIMGADGSGVRRLTFGDGKYGAPAWSPRGDYIAFTKMKSGTFYTGIIRPDGSGERLLTQSYLEESPSWSPNGRVIVFTRESGGVSKLRTVDITGRIEREAVTPVEASDPAWSNLLPL